MMGIQGKKIFAFMVAVSLSPTSLANNQELKDCQKKVKDIGGALGFLLAIETIFCCYVLFSWYRNSRINLRRNERNSKDPEQGESDYPMYTDADEVDTQDQTQTCPKNDRVLGLHQNQPATEKNLGQKFIERLMAKRQNQPKVERNLETTASPSNAQAVEEDVGGLVYSEPYEDKVSAASELMSRNPGMHFGKMNKEPPQEEQKPLVYYHVLEESVETDSKAPASPLKPPPFASNGKAREDVYYYCDSDNPNNKIANSKTTPSKPLPFASANEPEDDVYYSCVGEESASSPNQTNPKKALLPLPQNLKELSQKAATSGLAAIQQKPHFPSRENQQRNQKPEPANKKALMPMKSNPMMNAHMIQEMKNRVANKKSGN